MAEEETIEQWQKLLNEFSRHQIEVEETFMDLCHYKGERFEEICSRILAFYLNPNEKHRFRDLWFKALCKTIQCDIDISQIEIKQEEYTTNSDENRRIDLVLKTPTSVIAIENKINAKLYNKLEKYRDHINNTYNYITEKNRLFYVLTAHKLSDKDEKKATKNNYIVINYNDLFENVKSSLDEYASKGDKKYQYCMLDFMQTVNNRGKEMELNDFEEKFFAENHKKLLDVMFKRYKLFKQDVSKKIDELRKKLLNDNWKQDPYWNLYVFFQNNTPNQIGIVSNFEFGDDTPYGRFCIYIKTNNKECWNKYNDKIVKQYPDYIRLDKGEGNKDKHVYFHLKPIELKDFGLKDFDDNTDYKAAIIKQLKECYDFLKEITDNIDK